MKIAGLQKESLIDYYGKVSSVVFTPECNYGCPTCHAKKVLNYEEKISEDDFFDYLDSRKGWIDSVVICGGEPTLQPDLLEFIVRIKNRKLAVKLDTNGSNPTVLKELLEQNTIDYVAMDVKAPTYFYSKVTGKDLDFWTNIRESIRIVTKFPDYELRTTVVPILIDDSLKFMDSEDIFNTAREIYETTWNNKHKYFLQKFVARNKNEMIDEKFAKENLPKEMWETPTDILEDGLKKARLWLPKAEMRS